MDYEKAYKEALERAKKLTSDMTTLQKIREFIFPELRESEDERIRKAIVKSIEEDSSVYEQEVSKEQMLAYLEKQKEQKPAEWSEEDESMRWNVISIVGQSKSVQAEEMMDWLKSLRPSWRRDTYYDIIHSILDMLKDRDFTQITPEHRVSLLNDIRVKCKIADECAEILDEPSWKPSEEQMEAPRNIPPIEGVRKLF